MKKFIYFGFVASLCGSTLSGCNGGDTGIANSESKAAVYLPYDIDNTGCVKRFYANDENSIHVEIPSTYSIDGAGRIISGGAYQIKSIGDYCFANNNLVKSIFIPDSVTNIGRNAFYNCASLEKINISSFVVSIGDEALEGCSKLTKIEKTGDSGLLLSENDSMRSFSIPLSIKEIGSNVFNGWDNLYSLTINDGIIKIGDDSIKNNPQLAYVNIKSSLKDLGDNVFAACPLLTSLQWNESISGINFFKSQMGMRTKSWTELKAQAIMEARQLCTTSRRLRKRSTCSTGTTGSSRKPRGKPG